MQQMLAPAPHPVHGGPQENVSEQNLREQLLAHVQPSQGPGAAGPLGLENLRGPTVTSPRDHNIDPAIAGPVMTVGGAIDSANDEVTEDGSGKRSNNKRELSSSKRAAQNRAAQRAFRQRKEGYIKKLEEEVKDRHVLEETCKAIQAENYQLRDYIINLQSRLIESQGEYPSPPSNIDLAQPRQDVQQPRQLNSGNSSSNAAAAALQLQLQQQQQRQQQQQAQHQQHQQQSQIQAQALQQQRPPSTTQVPPQQQQQHMAAPTAPMGQSV